MRIMGTRTSLASSNSDPGCRQDATTDQIGGQKEVSPGWFVGASLGYESSWLVGDSDHTKVSGQVGLAGLMLQHETGPWRGFHSHPPAPGGSLRRHGCQMRWQR
jgi:hypothetical protein